MTNALKKTIDSIREMTSKNSIEQLIEKARPKTPEEKPLPESIPHELNWSTKATQDRQDFIRKITGADIKDLTNVNCLEDHHILRGNIENFIGMSQIPTGIIGPLRINGLEANGDFFIPMATSVIVSTMAESATPSRRKWRGC